MTGALHEMLAREHTLDLLCEAERWRSAGGVHRDRRTPWRRLKGLLTRPRRRPAAFARSQRRGSS